MFDTYAQQNLPSLKKSQHKDYYLSEISLRFFVMSFAVFAENAMTMRSQLMQINPL